MMKPTPLFLAGLLVLTASCAAPPSQNDAVQNKMLGQMNRMEANDKMAQNAIDELIKRNKELRGTVETLQGRVLILEGQLEQMKQARITPPLPPAGYGSAAVTPAQSGPSQEEQIQLTQTTLAELKVGTTKVKAAAEKLVPLGELAAQLAVHELQNNQLHPKYTPQLESLLALFSAGALKAPLTKALQNEKMHGAFARIIGAVGDRSLSGILIKLASDPDEDKRFLVAEAMVKCKNPAGLPPLISLLNSEVKDLRILSSSLLKKVNSGVDFSYSPYTEPSKNKKAIEEWIEWEKKFGQVIFK